MGLRGMLLREVVLPFVEQKLVYVPVFWRFAACCDVASKKCAIRFRSICWWLSISFTLLIQSCRPFISETVASLANVRSSSSSIISICLHRPSLFMCDFVLHRDTFCDSMFAAQFSNVCFWGSRCMLSIWVNTICSQLVGSHHSQNSSMNSEKVNCASLSHSVATQSSTSMFSKQPRIFVTFCSSVTPPFAFMK